MKKTLSTVAALVACVGFIGLAAAADPAPATHPAPAPGTHPAGHGTTPAQGALPPAAIDCMKQGEAKKLTGDAAKTFMDACLKAAGIQVPPLPQAPAGTQPPVPPKK
ncbi:MAG: hypothetical protein HQL77_03795 [Magnetococcales bacterium]|nr:hypothetical protein [Magnetococcales bacterium]